MVIKVIGMGCENCDKLYENVMEAVKETGSDAVVEKVGDLMEIVKLGVIAGRTAKTSEIVRLLKK